MGTLGFSFTGLIFLCCLFIPNGLYALRCPPKDPVRLRENRVLWIFEKTGQVLCTVLVLISEDINFHGLTPWAAWLAASALLMLLYLACWFRYFLGEHETRDFLRPVWGIPLPLASLPVTAVVLLAVYG